MNNDPNLPVEPGLPEEPSAAPVDEELAAKDATIADLEAQLADAKAAAAQQPPARPLSPAPPQTASPVAAVTETTGTGLIGLASAATQPPETPTGAQVDSTHAIGPGSAGDPVADLASKLEAAGEKTYLSDPNAQNPAHVFTDELMAAVRRVLHAHPEIVDVGDEAERQRLNRWINGLEVVTAEVQKLIADVAAQA
jgi:septal ring-binding cell division protein DamX